MGVPKFYRWISERYPCLSEVVKEFQLPEFDNLYLDMNGVVHVCSHPEDDNPHFRITEEQIFKDICHYIEFLFRMIKPRKVFFMAIDGVAPRAKMNQQRGRRFRSAREAEELIKKAQERGEELPTEKRFDSNCITPGTPFMKRLQDHLKYFVVTKVSTDPLWQGPKIILSGHETPGEGEHKVMDYIRYSRSQPGHDPNTRHCLYGLDADLIMLGLASHEPHFALLREEVRFGGKKDRNKRPVTPEETTFHLLHLSLMREYLDYEFSALKTNLPFEYSLENIIDDWILMGFLVGNDFIPHLPHLHIHHDALPLLWKTYMEVLPTLDGYLNEGGHLNLRRFEKYLGALAQFDRSQFNDQFVDMKYLEGKRGGGGRAAGGGGASASGKMKNKGGGGGAFDALQGLGDMDLEFDEDGKENGLLEAHLAAEGVNTGDLSSDEDFDTFDAEFSAHKRDYYMTKMEYETVTPEVLREQAHGYVRAIQWILLYYYEGVQSWSWFYPHHYAPYISDVRDFSDMRITFEMSEPFRPFEQLMAVLPAASKELLPLPLQDLMTNEDSPVIDYYPQKFKTDLNGKQQDWEAVVLIPFIEEEKLLAAMRTKESQLTAEEQHRNSHGPCYMYQYSLEQQGVYPSPMPGVFPDVAVSHAKICDIPKFHFCLEPHMIHKGLLPGTLLDVYFPGFPTLKNIPHEHRLDKCGVKVFQMNSRGFNMMLRILDLPERSLEVIARELLGQTTWVGWPHLHEAKVYAVADEKFRFEIEEHHKKGKTTPVDQWKRRELSKQELEIMYKEASGIREKYRDRFGVEVGKTSVLVYAGAMTGRKYIYTSQGKITAEKQFSTRQVPFALQATCKDVLTHAADDMHFCTMDELFPKDAAVFMLGNPHYGCQGEVLEVDNKEGRVRVSFNVLQEPNFKVVQEGQHLEHQQYMPGYVAAQRLGLSNHLLSRITGTVLILRGDGGNTESKANIGLNLKFTKRGEEVPGYTKKTEDGWMYSEKCLETINDYLTEFADLWGYIGSSHTGNSDIYTELELFPEESRKTLKETLQYLEQLPCSKLQSMKSGADIVGDATILAIERAVEEVVELNKKKPKRVKMQVKPHLLFRPLPNQGTLEPDPGTTFEILDRVVVVKMGYSVPFGRRGTVVGIHPGESPSDTLYDVIFDEEFVGGIALRCSSKRGYRVPAVAMLNLTYGEMRKHGHHHQQAAATPPRSAWQQQQQQQQQQQMPAYSHHGNRQGQGWGQGSYVALTRQGQGQGSYSALLRQEGQRQGPGRRDVMAPRQEQRPTYNSYGSHTQTQPQFVTPKMAATTPPKAVRGPPPAKQPMMPMADNDFTSIWNQLLQSNPTGGTLASKPPQPSTGSRKDSTGSQSPAGDGTSLQSAAEKLGKIALPSRDLMDVGHRDNPPTGILVDLTEAGPSGQTGNRSERPRMELPPTKSASQEREVKNVKVRVIRNSNRSQPKVEAGQSSCSQENPTMLALFEKATKDREAQLKGPSQPVLALSDQAQKAASISADPAAPLNEFTALFAALQVATKSASPSNQGASSQGAAPQPSVEDGSAALKQMLKIGVEEAPSNELVNKKSYGKQVSIQELFEGVKQAPLSSSMAETAAGEVQPTPHQSAPMQQGQQKLDQQQQLQQQQQPQVHHSQAVPPPLLHPPPLLSTPGAPGVGKARSPVDDLAALCQAAGQVMPKYDFNYHPRQKGFISLVTLPGGARFEGSMSPSREEAAESAASMAMLCLKQAQSARFPGQRGVPWMQVPGPGMGLLRPRQRLFSSNSAFSPVANPLMGFAPVMFSQPPPGLLVPPGQRSRQPLLSQPPPSLPIRGSLGQLSPAARAAHCQASQWSANQSQPVHPGPTSQSQAAHPGPANPGGCPSEPRHPVVHEVAPSRETAAGRESETGREGPVLLRSATEAFVPMQVTRKQRRKEETPEKQPPTKAASMSEGQSPPESGSTPSMNEGQSPSGSGHAPGMSNKKSPLGSHSTHSTSEGHSPLKLGSAPSKSEGQSLPESGSAPSKGAKLSSKSSASCLDDSVNNHSQDVRSVTDNSASKSGSHLASEQELAPKSKESESALGKSAAKEQGSTGSGKKRRPRIAANFNFDSSK